MPPAIPALLCAPRPTLSFEFFPPKDVEAERRLWHTVGELADLAPNFVSDPPEGPGGVWTQVPGGLRYAADLVRLLAGVGPFDIGVAAFPESHPESPSRHDDVRRAGAW